MNALIPEVMPQESDDLQQQVHTELLHWETIIADRLQAFFEVGIALATIRDKRLYRLEFDTFDDYCASRWDFSRQRASQVIVSGQVAANLKQLAGDTLQVFPQNERQARTIAKYSQEPAAQLELWQTALESAPKGRVSAAHLQRVAENLKKGDAPVQTEQPTPTSPKAEPTTSGGRLPSTLCLFCRSENVTVYPLGESRQGICKQCTEDAFAYHAQSEET